VALATAHQGRGELWDAYLVLEPFPDRYPHSDLRPAVIETEWQIGYALSRSNRAFLFFWSDAQAARTVLEHLITRHPDTPRLADALKILGDMAFTDGNYELAQQRFRDLMLNRPDSEWFNYAQYRFAMSIVASLEGPEYDLERMQHAVKELRSFLATNPENPELVREAKEAEQRLLEWQIERHLSIVHFYRRVGNVAGQLYHLDVAARADFASTSRYAEAVAARNTLRQSQGQGTPP
jgi:outer membrane protein assembly factor BamD (BamD/ComL family)